MDQLRSARIRENLNYLSGMMHCYGRAREVAAYVAELEERVAELEARLGAGACAQLEGLQDALHRRGAADRLSPQQEALDRAHNPQPESKEKA